MTKGLSNSDPIVIDSSDDDDADAEESNNDSNNHDKKPTSKRPYQKKDNSNSSKDEIHNYNTDRYIGKKKFCLIVLVKIDETCKNFISECTNHCSQDITNHCLQYEETLHFTIFNNKMLSYDEAMSLCYDGKSALPIYSLNGLMPWPSCIALESKTDISQTINGIEADFQWEAEKNLHMSIFRMRGFSHEKRNAFQNIKRGVEDMADFGSARGTKLILKEMAAAYDGSDGGFFRVLYENANL